MLKGFFANNGQNNKVYLFLLLDLTGDKNFFTRIIILEVVLVHRFVVH